MREMSLQGLLEISTVLEQRLQIYRINNKITIMIIMSYYRRAIYNYTVSALKCVIKKVKRGKRFKEKIKGKRSKGTKFGEKNDLQ